MNSDLKFEGNSRKDMKKGNMPVSRSHISVSSAINTDVRDQGPTINCSGVRSGMDGDWPLWTLIEQMSFILIHFNVVMNNVFKGHTFSKDYLFYNLKSLKVIDECAPP